MIKALKNKKGITLIEILVGSSLFAIIAATAFAALTPMMLAFSRANDIAEYNMILDTVGNRIVSDMAQASNVIGTLPSTDTITLTIRGSSTVVYFIQNGILHRRIGTGADPVPVFPPDFYGGKTVSFTVEGTKPDYTVIVTVNPAEDRMGATAAVVTREYAVRPLRLIS